MTQQNQEDQLDPQAPGRREMQPPIHTHPSDVMDAAAAEKVAGPAQPEGDPDAPPHVNTGVGSGPAMDPQVGGAGLGMPPAGAGQETPATTRDRDIRATDQQNTAGTGTSAAASDPGQSPVPRKEGEQTRDVLVDEVNQVNQDRASTQQPQGSGDASAPSGERPESVLPRVEGEETRDVLADEVSGDGAPMQQQQQQEQQQQQQGSGDAAAPAGERSASLLPKTEGDDTPQVAEEVSLDQQSDRVRGLGNLPADDDKTPAGSVAGAVAGSLGDTLTGTLPCQGQDGTPDGDHTAPRE
ncbi:MAG: hypothetical protein JWR65_540 [Massilia sp.]|nr:hypothetical protein [Massilia sp.]